MDAKPESKKNPSQKKIYVKPEVKRVPLAKGGLLEYCKPYICLRIAKESATDSSIVDNGVEKAIDLQGNLNL
jgi:hypothetical protein